MRVKHFSLFCVALLSFASLLGTGTARADSITYFATGTGGDGPLSASAAFVTTAGEIKITLTNLLSASAITAAGQALSDISFILSNAPGTLGATTASGQQGNISGKVATYTTGSPVRFLGQGPAPPNGSGTFSINNTTDTILMEALGGGQPSQMILPFLANCGTYSGANGGLDNFDPYTIGPATFTLALSGATANTDVLGVMFSFGTGPDTYVTGRPLPEPSPLLLLGTAIAGAALLLRRGVNFN
jgi:hypothetical protein